MTDIFKSEQIENYISAISGVHGVEWSPMFWEGEAYIEVWGTKEAIQNVVEYMDTKTGSKKRDVSFKQDRKCVVYSFTA